MLVVGLVVALVPAARSRARITHGQIDDAHRAATRLSQLEAVIAKDGSGQIERCGQPVTALAYQSELAWALGVNVGSVGWRPQSSIADGAPIVLFTAHNDGWQLSPIHARAADAAQCDQLRTNPQPRSQG